MRFMAFWVLSCMKLCPLQVTSVSYISVDPTMASCRCRADKGGTPFRLISEVSLASAFLALFAFLSVCSLKLSLESIHIPNHLVAPLFYPMVLFPTLTPLLVFSFQCRLLLDKRIASVFSISNVAALFWPHSMANLAALPSMSETSLTECNGGPSDGRRYQEQ